MMSLQDIFYIVGITAMTLSVILFIVLIFVLLFLKKKITDIYTLFEKNFMSVKDVISHPGRIVSTVSEAFAGKAITKAMELMGKKKQKA